MEQRQIEMRTALFDRHCALGAKIVEFCGWEMPVQYQGIIPEHKTVREKVGIFDVSHMGRILVEGADAEKYLDYLSTNAISGKEAGSATYTVWSTPKGGCVDDVIVYKIDSTHFFVIVNAGNRQKDLAHLKQQSMGFNVQIQDRFQEEGIIAIQGPKALNLISEIFPEAQQLKFMHFVLFDNGIILSATGYTGSGGFEVYAPHALIVKLWDQLLEQGQKYGIAPIGLGARDTLRLEMGYALYGHELSEEISANESVSAWTLKWGKDFLGKEAMQKIEPNKRREYGVVLLEKGIAREGYEVFHHDQSVGKVTSGNYSPTLDKAIAIILVKEKLSKGDIVEIQIRNNRIKAEVVELPFYSSKRSKNEIHTHP